ncbi:RING finger protein nhl-1-like [Oopsacas minuta]|uniref:RING finger protein nhl-1-like n=1 Tax=Oopsacas minuta TaxID=111878 RepID=A0AAV7JDN1_9METZ|nr:RING finger protein nhl-1-like [Oopsacas minuta]
MKRECDTGMGYIPSDSCYRRELNKLERDFEKKNREIIDKLKNESNLTITAIEDSIIAMNKISEILRTVRYEFEERTRLRDEACWLQQNFSKHSSRSTHTINERVQALNHELLAYMRLPTPHLHLDWTTSNNCTLHTTYNPYTFKSRPIWAVSSQGRPQHQLLRPHSLTIDPGNGNIYVADIETDRIQVFDSEGGYLKSFRNESLDLPAYLVIYEKYLFVRCFERLVRLDKKSGDEVMTLELEDRLKGLAVDTQGYIYSCDSASNIVFRFSPFLEQQDSIQYKPYTHSFQQNRSGSVRGSRKPRDLKLVNNSFYILFGDSPYPIQSFTKEDMFGNILVTSPYVQKIKVFSNQGDLLSYIGTPGRNQPGELLTPRGVAVGPLGQVVICDEKVNNCLQSF